MNDNLLFNKSTYSMDITRMKLFLALLIFLFLPLFGLSQTVTNGSVTGSPAGNNVLTNAAGWSVCNFSPDLCDVGFPSYSGGSQVAPAASPDGGTWLGLAAVGSGECAQTTITGLTVGNSYTLCFYGANFGTGALFNSSPSNPDICVGATCTTVSIPQVAGAWTQFTLPFTATATSMTLSCTLAGDDSYCGLDGFTISTPGASAAWTDPSPLCSSQAPINLDALVTGTPGGVWSGTGVTGNTFDPAAGSQAVTYTVNPGTCDEVFQTININVTSGANGAWTVPTGLCTGDAPIDLNPQITGDTGGTWSGTGMSGSFFDPAVGSQNITYSVGVAPCDDVVTQLITVNPNSDPSWTPPVGLCTSSPQVDLSTLITGDTGGTWSGTGVTGNMFDPSVGTQSITYDVGIAPCNGVSTQTITVGTAADPSWTVPVGLCTGQAPIDLNTYITGTPGGTWSGTGVTGSMFDPSVGTQTITYDVGTAPCDGSLAQTITVTTNSDPAWTPPAQTCSTDPQIDLNTLITGTPGGTWSGTGVTGTMFDPSSGTQTVTYTVGTAPCDTFLAQSIVVTTTPDPSWTPPGTTCENDAPIDLSTLVTGTAGGTWSGTGVTGNMFDPSVGTQTITYDVGSAPCTASSAQTITVTPNGDASWTPPLNTCIGDAPFDLNAFITGTAGGTWSGTGVTGNMFDPSVGTQTVTYTVGTAPCDASSAQSIVVTAASDPSWTPAANVCESDSPIDLNSLITGDIGGAWSGTGVTGNMFDPAVGTQSLTYTVGSGGCQGTLTQSLTVNPDPDPSWTTLTLCQSSAPVNMAGQITGASGGTWSGTGMSGSIFDPFFGTQNITYTVTQGACSSTLTQSVTVVDPVVTTTVTGVSCFGLTDGSANASVSGGSGNYTYSWNPSGQTTASVSGLGAGTYIVTVTDVDGGCSVQDSVTVIEPAEIVLTMTGQDACYPDLGAASVNATGGVGGFTYSWTPVASTAQMVTGIDSSMATVVVTDGNGCTATDSVMVNVWPLPTPMVSPDTLIFYEDTASLWATGGVSYEWSPTSDLDCYDCPNPNAYPLQATEYCVTVTDANGCEADACTFVDIEIVCGDIFVPSAFSPNNDGENDVLCVYSDCMQSMTFTIYNRWGEAVFTSSSLSICWDGTWKGKELNSAVFVYVLNGYLINGESIEQKGNISLIR
ncbi:MAG: gliding motility-associated C-terminal domain-containing protein [Crocinitomicaceae bacterium]|nr:gliding motility-associated C-terminal domain-containing protein [Crocinitomicaceae bacterium]